MIIISDPENKAPLPVKTLTLLFGLTSTEARLAFALANGNSLTEAADQHRVRHELKAHTNRPGESLRLLNGLIGPLRLSHKLEGLPLSYPTWGMTGTRDYRMITQLPSLGVTS
jgi:hypothetical protein